MWYGEVVFKNYLLYKGLPWWLSDKKLAYNAGDAGSIPGSGRSSGGTEQDASCKNVGNEMEKNKHGSQKKNWEAINSYQLILFKWIKSD